MVTNKHVLQDASEITVQMIRADGMGDATPAATRMILQGFGEHAWTRHPDPAVDVAVLNFNPVLAAMTGMQAPAAFRAFALANAMTAAQADDLDAIEHVTFIGYPNGIFDEHNFLPVARRGHTATPPSVDYESKPALLTDASVSPGSSGSRVLILDNGVVADKYRNRSFGTSRLLLAGILAAVHTQQVDGPVTQLPVSHVASIQQPIDLRVVYKASAVLETVDLWLASIGANRD